MVSQQAAEDSGPTTTRIQVVVRVRPVLAQETDDVAVSCSEDGGSVKVDLPFRQHNKGALPGQSTSIAKSYDFDACLPGRTTQEDLAEVCSLNELVGQALDGFSVTIFAFGQTGSGKTHTMVGPRLSRGAAVSASGTAVTCDKDDGLLPRCLAAAWQGMEQRQSQRKFKVTSTCVELYNEAATDLLGENKAKQLQVRKDERGGFRVDGLSHVECSSAGSALQAMSKALIHRHTRAHALNEYSSRSHCLMTFHFDSQEEGEGKEEGAKGGVRRHGKLVLVDLAGSERLKATGSSGAEAVRETGSINKSLFTLGQVLSALAAKSGGRAHTGPVHVPYRDSKLTQLLWDGLRGTGRVLMLACLGPLAGQAEESLNTLHFASMALRIKAQPVVFVDPQDALVMDLRNTIKQLQEENRQLASAMTQLSNGMSPAEVFASLPDALKLAAARDTLSSAPARNATEASTPIASASSPTTGRKAQRPTTEAGLASPTRALPWRSNVNTPGSHSNPAHVNILSLSHGTNNAALQHDQLVASLLATPAFTYNMDIFTKSKPKRTAPSSTSMPYLPRQPAAAAAAAAAQGSAAGGDLRDRLLAAANVSPAAAAVSAGPSSGLAAAARQLAHGPLSAPMDLPRAAPAPRSMHMDAFPELAALEAQFQSAVSGAPVNTSDTNKQPDEPDAPPPPPPPPKPEPKALSWAERNTWFGTNESMTAYAYEVHDDLINNQKMDAASDEYYDAIESKVKERFPDEWAQWEEEVRLAAERAAQREREGPPPPPTTHNYWSTLRVMGLKDPVPWEEMKGLRGLGTSGLFSPQRGLNNPNLAQASRYSVGISDGGVGRSGAGAAGGAPGVGPLSVPPVVNHRQTQQQNNQQPQSVPAPGPNRSYGNLNAQGSGSAGGAGTPLRSRQRQRRAPSPMQGQAAGGGGGTGRALSGADYMSAAQQEKLRSRLLEQLLQPPSPGKLPPAPHAKLQSPAAAAVKQPGAALLRKLDLSAWTTPGLTADLSMAELQKEYMRQRYAVLEELRQAKADAERERSRILAKINRTLGSSRWR